MEPKKYFLFFALLYDILELAKNQISKRKENPCMSSLSHPKYHRQRIVKYAQKHSVTKTALRYRVSRKTVYKWLSRYDGTLASQAP